jgi:hypothetical protein
MRSPNFLRRVLGYYLVAIGISQLVLYTLLSISESFGYLFYFDPRFGLFFIETILRQHEQIPAILGWVSAAVIIAMGLWVRSARVAVTIYLIVEGLIAIPTFLILIMLAAVNMSANHGFSRGEILFPLIVCLLTSTVPMVLAIYIIVIGRVKETSTLGLG